MRIVDVLPLSRGVFRERLSYFSSDENISLGTIVVVPVRNRETHALVVLIRDATEVKSEIRGSGFSLKKLSRTKGKLLLLPEFIKAIEETAHYFGGNTGSLLSAFLPKIILENLENSNSAPDLKQKIIGQKIREVTTIQAGDQERFSEYKSLIRERFARNLSVFLCFSTTQEADELLSSLDRGIKDYSFLLHSGLSKKEILSAWRGALKEKHPVLIIGTGTFLSIPREDIGTIIIERESSRFYKSNVRPYADVRVFAEKFAKARDLELILGDISLRVETLYKVENGEYAEFGSALKFRSLWSGTYRIVDMRVLPGKELLKKHTIEVLSSDLRKIISELSLHNERLFIYTARRGLSPVTLCGDCGTVVNCTRCRAPITLHRGGTTTFFLCHHCGEKRGTEEYCRICKSWKLETVGAGIEMIEEVIKKDYPKSKLFRLDKDSAKTNLKALDIATKFFDSPGSILLGTEVALYYLKGLVENSAIISIDSLFSLPDFRINERIFSMILNIRARSQNKMIIQTRNIEASVLAYAASGTISDFYKEEIEMRERFLYPPFSILIKISLEGRRETVEKEVINIQKSFEGQVLEVSHLFSTTYKGKHVVHIFLKVRKSEWPSLAIIEKLKALPVSVKVQVEPESIL